MAEQNGIFRKHVRNEAVTIANAAQADFTINQGYPRGLLRSLLLRIYGSFTGAPTGTVTDGEKAVLRSFSFESTLHGPIVQNMDGLGWYRIISMLQSYAPRRALSTAAHSCAFPIPLAYPGTRWFPAFRLNDMATWAKKTLLTLKGTLGPATDMVSGGTAPTSTATARLSAQYEPNPIPSAEAGGGDAPMMQPLFERSQFPGAGLTAGTGFSSAFLSGGADKKLIGILWSERNSSTRAEVSDVFTADDTKVVLRHGTDRIIDETRQTDLDIELEQFLGFAPPTGWHGWLAAQDGKLTDWRDLRDSGKEFEIAFSDIATAATRQVFLYPLWALPIRKGAEADVQDAQPVVTQ